MAETKPAPWGETTIVGKPITRIDAAERVGGRAVYPLDVSLPNMLHAAILRCPHAHANVKKVDLSKAREMPGVRAVLSDADPEAHIGWYLAASRLFDPHCRYEGEEVAAVAAETPLQARDALRAIRVEYEELPFVTNMEDALKPGATAIQGTSNVVSPGRPNGRGDVEKGFAEADVVLEETYRTSCEIHTPLEAHGSVARWDGDLLTIWDSNQGPFPIQKALAAALNMPLSKIRVISKYVGGAFGGKLILGKYSVIAALLARKTAQPVKLFLSREETFIAAGNRPAHSIKIKAGVKKDGTLTALQVTGTAEAGAYVYNTVVSHLMQELYKCANVSVQETMVFINACQGRAMRAPGHPPAAWALEQMMDALAVKIGMDPVDLRLKNISTVSQTEGNKPYTSTGLSECLTKGAEEFGWKQARARAKETGSWVRGVGVASAVWRSTGWLRSTVIVRLFADGSVNLNMGAADLGTGTKTIMAMVVAEELGVPLSRIQVEHADTGTTQFSNESGSSKTVTIDSPAVRAAALEVKARLLEMAAAQLKVPVADLALKGGEIVAAAAAKKVAVKELTELQAQQVVVGVGERGPNPTDKVIKPFSTHFAEVEVNRYTGELRVVRMLAMQDSGRAMNPLTFRTQVFGGLTMGIGFAMTEKRLLDSQTGKMVNANFHDYKIPTAKDVPADLAVHPIDLHDTECNTTGTKGLGEPATVPAAAAIANAFYHATGIRITDSPISLAKVVALLAERKKQG